jgi:Na+/melibiose symporter-like transporter
MLLALIQLFTPRGPVGAGHLALWSIVLWFGWTMIAIPYYAWGAELSLRYHERTRIASWRTACSVGGILTALAAPPLSAYLFGYGATLDQALTIVAVATVATTVVAVTWLLARVPEPPPLQVRRVGLREGFRIMWLNGPFKRLMIAVVLSSTGPALAAPLYILYLDHVIGTDMGVALTLLVYYAGNLAGISLLGALAERIGKHHAWMAGIAVLALCQPVFLVLGPGDLVAMLVTLAVTGVAGGCLVALPSAMKADVIDVDRLASGADRAGLFFSSWSLAQKAVTSLAMGSALLILALFEFDTTDGNGPLQTWALKLTFAGLPLLCYAGALLVIRPYPITEAHQRLLLRQLAARAT